MYHNNASLILRYRLTYRTVKACLGDTRIILPNTSMAS